LPLTIFLQPIFTIMSFAEKAIQFYSELDPKIKLKNGVDWIRAFDQQETLNCFSTFMHQFYNDAQPRTFLLGINPGRFGAGVTGVAFTDPIQLEEKLKISNSFEKKHELSAIFIHEVIDALGGPETFFSQFFITSVNPLGLIKDNKNYNYYDDAINLQLIEPFIIECMNKQLKYGYHREKAFSIGQGKNFKYLKKLNDTHKWFDEIIPLPHPRWVLQYKRKFKEQYIIEYIEKLS